jgi:uncharacterized phage protein gp47/JayE
MAYENMTYEVILKRMIDSVIADYPNVDMREGSIIYNALAPAAIELAVAYTELDNVLKESFIDTASREYIIRLCNQVGMNTFVFNASAGEHKALFNVEVPIGSRWNLELYNYEVMEYLGEEDSFHAYKVVCETVGTEPNTMTGDLTAITDVPDGLTDALLVECLVEGEDETEDADIVSAYYDHVNSSTADGNVDQYKSWCDQFSGVGNSRVFPLWNGDNTVKVSILTPSNRKASDELVAEFQEYLDPNSEGMGNGVAPIGAVVTVSTATETPINIAATVTMRSGYSDTTAIDTAVTDYLTNIAYEKNTVAYMNIGSAILNAEGVDAVNGLTINGGTADISLGDEEIAVLGTTNWTVV